MSVSNSFILKYLARIYALNSTNQNEKDQLWSIYKKNCKFKFVEQEINYV